MVNGLRFAPCALRIQLPSAVPCWTLDIQNPFFYLLPTVSLSSALRPLLAPPAQWNVFVIIIPSRLNCAALFNRGPCLLPAPCSTLHAHIAECCPLFDAWRIALSEKRSPCSMLLAPCPPLSALCALRGLRAQLRPFSYRQKIT
jgi:hypothetical protein